MDEMVLETQQWLNKTYGDDSRFNRVSENGRTGWETVYGLTRALQIEEGIQETSDNFGPTTMRLCPTLSIESEDASPSNYDYILQGGLWCKGYSPGGFTGVFYKGTQSAINQSIPIGCRTFSNRNCHAADHQGTAEHGCFCLGFRWRYTYSRDAAAPQQTL